MELDVIGTAANARPESLAGRVVVLVDVMRASSVIATALNNGCQEVIPLLTVEETRERAGSFSPGDCLTGGERGALIIEGFDLGNSPLEYTEDKVKGRSILLTTSNGTRAFLKTGSARQVLVGGFVNASAVVKRLLGIVEACGDEMPGITILCAGTSDCLSLDDYLCAGLLTADIQGANPENFILSDSAVAARELYRAYRGRMMDIIKETAVYRTVVRLGLEADLEYCLRENIIDLAPIREGERIIK